MFSAFQENVQPPSGSPRATVTLDWGRKHQWIGDKTNSWDGADHAGRMIHVISFNPVRTGVGSVP